MIDPATIAEIIKTYEKYGWQLRRILLTTALKDRIGGDFAHLFNGIQVMVAEVDAAWFSRPPKAGGVAWEIRHLSETPFALLENLDENETSFEDALRAVETRLRETVGRVASP